MPISLRSPSSFKEARSFILLAAFLCVLWVAGGASRADVLGQVVVRTAALVSLLALILFGRTPDLSAMRPVGWFLAAAFFLTLLQLTPLPPAVWQALPGRAVLSGAAAVSGQSQPWRPLTMSPGATANAAASLIVPLLVLLLMIRLREHERKILPGLLLLLISASMFVGLLQFSGIAFKNPLINDAIGQVSGTFANRNHFALFMAFGCLVAPAWPFLGGRTPQWRGPVAICLILLFELAILASGSRAGLLLGILALGLGITIAQRAIRRALDGYPRWVFPALIVVMIGIVGGITLLSFSANRAISINRFVASDLGQDMRSRAFPTVVDMVREYFPVGTGFGSFDPVFRLHEPLQLLRVSYFNHAHNDLLEVVLDGGIGGLALLLAAILWWGTASLRAWRGSRTSSHTIAKLGSAMLLLVALASAFDYPARTPMIMATIIIASIWLSGDRAQSAALALPKGGQHL